MKTLHRYLIRQVLATLMMTVAVFTFILLLGNALKEILVLLINRQATLGGVAEAIGLLIPFVLVFALPMGMLTAALLVFGRFSADQELTAVKSSGISLLSLVTPMLFLSLLLCGVSAAMNMEIAPRCRNAYKDLIFSMGAKMASAALPEGRFIYDFDGYIIYVGHNDGKNLEDIHICELDTNKNVISITDAPRGTITSSNQLPTLTIYDFHTFKLVEDKWESSYSGFFTYTPEKFKSESGKRTPKVNEMSFTELRAEVRRLENQFSIPDKRTDRKDLKRAKAELNERKKDILMPLQVQMHRQIAFSFACFGFTLVGIPLGIQAHRRETNVGIAMALILVLVYYSFIILGQSLDSKPQFAPHLIVWLPNFLFQAVGAVMLWRANRGI